MAKIIALRKTFLLSAEQEEEKKKRQKKLEKDRAREEREEKGSRRMQQAYWRRRRKKMRKKRNFGFEHYQWATCGPIVHIHILPVNSGADMIGGPSQVTGLLAAQLRGRSYAIFIQLEKKNLDTRTYMCPDPPKDPILSLGRGIFRFAAHHRKMMPSILPSPWCLFARFEIAKTTHDQIVFCRYSFSLFLRDHKSQ